MALVAFSGAEMTCVAASKTGNAQRRGVRRVTRSGCAGGNRGQGNDRVMTADANADKRVCSVLVECLAITLATVKSANPEIVTCTARGLIGTIDKGLGRSQ